MPDFVTNAQDDRRQEPVTGCPGTSSSGLPGVGVLDEAPWAEMLWWQKLTVVLALEMGVILVVGVLYLQYAQATPREPRRWTQHPQLVRRFDPKTMEAVDTLESTRKRKSSKHPSPSDNSLVNVDVKAGSEVRVGVRAQAPPRPRPHHWLMFKCTCSPRHRQGHSGRCRLRGRWRLQNVHKY
ncbi:hypothetical protein ACOMHN_006443 [Nucella lapillus]